MRRMTLCLIFIVLFSFGSIWISCSNREGIAPNISEIPISEGQSATDMTSTIIPQLYLAANGSSAVLNSSRGKVDLYNIPDLSVRYSNNAVPGLDESILSSSGQTLALRTSLFNVTLIQLSRTTHDIFPDNRGHIVGITISDSGDKLAILLRHTLYTTENPNNGTLEIWRFPFEDQPLAKVALPILNQGYIQSDENFTQFAVSSFGDSGDKPYTNIFIYLPEQQTLSSLYDYHNLVPGWHRVSLYNNWIWAVYNNEIIGWMKPDTQVSLPGTAEDILIFSPSGDYLLIYRLTKLIENSTARFLFRLIDLTSLVEIKRVEHDIENYQDSYFAIDSDLTLFQIKIASDASVILANIEW